MTPRYSLIVPAHNEAARIEPMLRAYAGAFSDSEIIVVLNGCTDGTGECVGRLKQEFGNIEYVEIDAAVGKGGAVRAGFLIARADVVGFVDADGSTSAHEMRRLFDRLGANDALIASRWIAGATIHRAQPFKRRWASRVFNALIRVFFGLSVRDSQCGAKVFRAHCLRSIMSGVETSNMAFDVDLLYALKRAGVRVIEEPTEWTDVSGTSVRIVPAARAMLRALIRLRLRHAPFVHYVVPFFDRFFGTQPIRVHDGFSILILNWRDPKHPQAGGAETYLFEMARRWAAGGNDVEWITAGFKGAAKQETLDGVAVTRVGN
ncbi:MAG: glycosyltransferase, partial [Candidatus Baltobacteraceae bacterium]